MKTTATIGALLTSFTVLAAPRPLSAVPKKLAVLEFHNYTGISEHEAMFLTDLVRGAAVLALPEEGYLVMTRESIFELLPPGKTLTDCVGECEVETGRNIGADYIVSGELIRFGASLRLSLKLFETQTSRLIGTQTVKAGAVEELEAPIRTASNTLFRKIGGRAVEGDRSPSGADPGSGPTFVAPATQGAGPGESKLVEIKPTERPKAKSGPAGIYITTEPKGAEVLIGDVKVGDTDPAFQRADLRPGDTVRVTLEKEEYHPVRFDVTLRPGIARYEGIELKPAFGALEILSEPAGARVTLGGAEVGVTPYTKERLPSGRHLVSLDLELHEGVRDEIIEVKDGERTSRTFRLAPDFGTLEVASSPSGAAVKIDGRERGSTPLELRLPPGAYEVAVGKSGYHGRSYEITVARGQGVAIGADQAALERIVGSLLVLCDPPEPGAVVLLDGAEKGRAPLTVEGVPVGEHEVEVRAGGKVGRKKVEVVEGEVGTVTVALGSGFGGIVKGALGVEMVEIPAGRFAMGSPASEDGRFDSEQRHEVVISRPFLAGKHEVTQGLWKAVMGSNPSRFDRCGEDCPVEKVSWHDAVAFCNRLSEREGLTPAYRISGDNVTWDRSARGYRLPTEAEWEYACRAGTATRFHTGDADSDLGRAGWYDENSGGKTHPAGGKRPNAWGLHDMHGNVWEWCWDWYGDYPERTVTDPAGPSGGSYRVYRGGSWNYDARNCRSAFRRGAPPGRRNDKFGFRLFRSK